MLADLPQLCGQIARQLRDIALQSEAEAAEHCKRHIAFASFDGAKIGPIDIRNERQLFLCQPDALALCSDTATQFAQNFLLVHSPAWTANADFRSTGICISFFNNSCLLG